MAHESTGAVEHGDGPALPCVEVDGPRCRVRTAKCSTPWLPDTPSNRHLSVGWGRLVRDEADQPCGTVQAGAVRVGSANRQAASHPLEDGRQCGEDVRALVLRQRKVDTTVVDGVLPALLQTPGAGPTELVARVNAPWGRDDLTTATLASACEQISCVPGRRTRRRQLAAGHGPSHEAWRLTERLEHGSPPARPPAGWGVPGGDGGRRLADPTALAALVTPALPLAQVPGALGWLTFRMTLFSWHGPVSVLGRWGGVQKTTMGRWVLGWALAGWPLIARWLGERVRASMVDVDATWLKSRGRWHSWFVVLDVPTAGPVLAVLLPSRGQWACRGVDWQLRQRTHVPQGLITDGGQADASLVPGAQHVWCRVHHQQGVTPWLQQRFATAAESTARTLAMRRVFHPRDQRTVRRRLAWLKARAAAWGMTPWVTAVAAKRPPLISRGGSVRLPSTSNAVARFCRSFQRFSCTRGGVHAGLSATREVRLWLVVYLCTQHATTGQAPIAVIVPAARFMPLYRLINDPFRALQERADVTPEASMADFLRPQAAGA